MNKQSVINKGHYTVFGNWIDAKDKKPPMSECYGEFWHSERVLVTDGYKQWLGYLQSWEADEYRQAWKMDGPDGYDIIGVTHWMPLPPLPAIVNKGIVCNEVPYQVAQGLVD